MCASRRAAEGCGGLTAKLAGRYGPNIGRGVIREGSSMEITEVRVFPVNEERLKAYVTITLDACFVVRDLKVINGNTGPFVAMPAKRRKDGTFKDIAHPLNSETRERMEKIILAEYERELARGTAPTSPDAASG